MTTLFNEMTDGAFPVPIVKMIPARELTVDDRFQRWLDHKWVDRMEPAFNPAYLGIVAVSHREDGTFSVIDGQHRVELTKRVLGGDHMLECEVFTGLSLMQEARLFLDRNQRRPVKPQDRFKASVAARDPKAVAIVGILESLGLTWSDQRKDGAVNAVVTLQKVYDFERPDRSKVGPLALTNALRTAKEAWGIRSSSFEGHIIEGLGLIYARYSGAVDSSILAEKLGSRSGGARGLLATARITREINGKSVARNVAAAAVTEYNKGRRVSSLRNVWT